MLENSKIVVSKQRFKQWFSWEYWLTYRPAPMDRVIKNIFVCRCCRVAWVVTLGFLWYQMALIVFQMGLCPFECVMLSTGAVCCHAVFLTVLHETNKVRFFKLQSGVVTNE